MRSQKNKRDPTFFNDGDFHNVGIGIMRHNVVALACKAEQEINSGKIIDVDVAAIQSDTSVVGRFLVTKKEMDVASFKTPGLRNVLITAPYFHDGSQATLWDVMDHYNKGAGLHNPWLDEDIQPLALSEPEIDDVVAFLATLTSAQYRRQGVQELARQRALAEIGLKGISRGLSALSRFALKCPGIAFHVRNHWVRDLGRILFDSLYGMFRTRRPEAVTCVPRLSVALVTQCGWIPHTDGFRFKLLPYWPISSYPPSGHISVATVNRMRRRILRSYAEAGNRRAPSTGFHRGGRQMG